MKKWLYYLLVGMYMDKVKIFCDHSMTLREMTDNLPASVHFWTPPASFRVKKTFLLSQMVTSWTYFFAFENQNQTILQSIGLDIMYLGYNGFILHVWIFASLAFALPCETKSWWYEGDLFVFYVSKPSWDLDVVSYSTEQ